MAARDSENIYERAAATWVARRFGLDAEKVSGVEFKVAYGGGCETCGYEAVGISYLYKTTWREDEIGSMSAGAFVAECSAIVEELRSGAVAVEA